MRTYRVLWDRRALARLEKMPADVQERLARKVLDLKTEPRGRGKPLKGPFKGAYRLRVGDYRVVFEVDDAARAVWITLVGARKDIY